jgi:hypothetical protein
MNCARLLPLEVEERAGTNFEVWRSSLSLRVVTTVVRGREDPKNAWRGLAAERVLDCFASFFTGHRLLCFLDNGDWDKAKIVAGPGNRGFYIRVNAAEDWWNTERLDILTSVFVNRVQVVDHFIYLNGTTCSRECGLTMTLAHELQHFVQRTTQTRLWAANTLITQLTLSEIKRLGLTGCNIPHERDARIVSKRMAENLLGVEQVRDFI